MPDYCPEHRVEEWPGALQGKVVDPLAPVGAYAGERLKPFLERARRHFSACLADLRRRGIRTRAPFKTANQHFEWLARHQVGRESYYRIARSMPEANVEDKVAKGIRPAARVGSPAEPRRRSTGWPGWPVSALHAAPFLLPFAGRTCKGAF
jgi:hypothetical protein